MNKFYTIKGLISLSNYSKKYKITLRKIYRYIGDQLIEHYMIDDMPYLPDKKIPLLFESHTRNQLINSVKTLTESVISVKSLTESNQEVENQEVNSVKILTETQISILNTPDVKLNSKNLERKYKLMKLLEEITNV